MARFIEVTEAGSSRFLNVDAIAELEPSEDGASITMLWSRESGRAAVHNVSETVDEMLVRIAAKADVGRGRGESKDYWSPAEPPPSMIPEGRTPPGAE